MSRYIGGIIHPTARYRTQTSSQSRGVYDMKEQYQHKANGNWHSPSSIYPSNIGERMPVTIYATSTSADSTQDFNVHHADFDAAAAVTTTGRLWFAIKNTALHPQHFHNDFCIGAVQITSNNYSTLEHGWSFNVTSDYTDWQYATVTNLGLSGAGFENYSDIVEAPSQVWAASVDSVANVRISRDGRTGSTFTGANDGVSSEFSDSSTGTIIGASTSTIAQTVGTEFMFTESTSTSGTNSQNKWYWWRSPEVSLNGESNKHLAIVYHIHTNNTSTGASDAADNQMFRWWWA